jgi:hypothetical protein
MAVRSKPAARKGRAAAFCATLLACIAAPAIADYDVGAGGTSFIASGRYDLACTDLLVAGTLNLDTGTFVNVRDVIVQPGGVLNGGSGTITLSRNFTVSPGGQFNAQAATVAYDATCGPGAAPAPVPALGDVMLIALSGLLAAMAMFFAGAGAPRRRTDPPKGAGP